MAMAMAALLAALWAGLLRLGWALPLLQPTLPMSHGPLIIGGFLGTVIGVERAVALGRPWAYLGPLLTGLGGLVLLIGMTGLPGPLLITLGSLMLVVVFGLILRLQLAPFTVTMALGALLWLVGNLLWLFGWPVYQIVLWWLGFLTLTIAGERLELNRVLRLSGKVQQLFQLAVAIFLVGLAVTLFHLDSGMRLAGVGLVALAGWLLRYDIARYTVRKTGLTRFIALCLLTGYVWLGLGGLLVLFYGGVTAGLPYDAILHAVFLGFVMAMIFGHAPIIFPAVLGKPINFSSLFYSHLALLHLSLLLRVGGDLMIWLPARQWGGLLNVVAILLFMANTVRAVHQAARDASSKKIASPSRL
ncbi:MAG: hypothetical protein L6R45_02875 [Anaerolineae bacterium]|nr:hypothetical protein [Anaerolineae bacterium]